MSHAQLLSSVIVLFNGEEDADVDEEHEKEWSQEDQEEEQSILFRQEEFDSTSPR